MIPGDRKWGRTPRLTSDTTGGVLVLAVRHECLCGHPFLICVHPEHGTESPERETRWAQLVRLVATKIGASYVEARNNARFTCSRCGSVALVLSPRPRLDGTFTVVPAGHFVASLN